MDDMSPALGGAPAGWTTRALGATVVAVVVCVVLNTVEIVRSGTDAQHWGVLADLSEAVVPLLAAYLLARRASITGDRGWWWLSAGALAWAAGQVTWMILDFGLDRDPTVSVATVGFVGWSVLTAVGLLKIGGHRRGFTSPRPIVAEASIMAACAGFLVWELALASQTRGETAFAMVMLAIVPLSTAFVGSVAVLL